jgi:hypothetical protein
MFRTGIVCMKLRSLCHLARLNALIHRSCLMVPTALFMLRGNTKMQSRVQRSMHPKKLVRRKNNPNLWTTMCDYEHNVMVKVTFVFELKSWQCSLLQYSPFASEAFYLFAQLEN